MLVDIRLGYIYIYIYIYIYCHPQTGSFVVSQLFSVVRHVGRFKLELKQAELHIRLSIIPFSQQLTYFSSGIIRHYVVAFVYFYFALPDTRVLNSLEGLYITRVAAVNSFGRGLNPRGEGAYILSHTHTHTHTHIYIYIYIYTNRIWNQINYKAGCLNSQLKQTKYFKKNQILNYLQRADT